MSINSSTTSTSCRLEMGHALDAGFHYLNHIYTAQISREPELDGFHDLLYSYDNDFSVVHQATIKNRRLRKELDYNDFKPIQFWLSAQLRCIYNLINESQYPELDPFLIHGSEM